MGIIVRQSILTSVISYAGVVIGYINLLYLFPKFLDPEQVGLLRTVQDTAMLFVPFAVVGLGQSIIKFYPQLAGSDREANGFITMILLYSLVTVSIFLAVFLLFEDLIMSYFHRNARELTHYKNLILGLTLFLVMMTLLEQYSRSLLQIAFPGFLREVVIRLLQSALVLIYYFNFVDFSEFLAGSVWIYLLALGALALFLFSKGGLRLNLDFRSITSSKKREILVFSLLSFVGTSSMILIGKMDSVMVTGMVGLSANAIYTTAFYMATVIEIPKRAITTTASPLIAKAFGSNNLEEIRVIYQKTSINQYIIGSLLLIGVYANVENIFQLMPRGDFYEAGSYVILLVGTGKLLDMLFGPSSEIIGLSRHYWFNLVVITLLAIMVVAANYVFIPVYGIEGAAFGSLLSLLVYNAAKFVFIQQKFHLQPFTAATVKVTVINAVVLGINYMIPTMENIFVDIALRSAIITIAFATLILASKSSIEVNKIFFAGVDYLRKLRP